MRSNDLKAAGPDAPSHHWFYAPEMRAEEAILIKSYDSGEGGIARFAPHTSFEEPTAPADKLPPAKALRSGCRCLTPAEWRLCGRALARRWTAARDILYKRASSAPR